MARAAARSARQDRRQAGDGVVKRVVLAPGRDQAAPATRPAIIDLVAATERSGPAISGSSSSASVGERRVDLVDERDGQSRPPRRAERCISTMSGLRPDCEIATETARESRSGVP